MLSLLVSIRFQILFHSPLGVLFTFPSRYYTLSVTRSYLALGDGPPIFPPDSTCPVVLWILTTIPTISLTRLLLSFVQLSNCVRLCLIIDYVSPSPLQISLSKGLGSFPFAHHYLGNRLFTFFSSGYLDVSVPRVPFTCTIYSYMDTSALPEVSFLIRRSTGQSLFAAHRSLSQLVTSFFGAWCQGIHHMPLLALIIYV